MRLYFEHNIQETSRSRNTWANPNHVNCAGKKPKRRRGCLQKVYYFVVPVKMKPLFSRTTREHLFLRRYHQCIVATEIEIRTDIYEILFHTILLNRFCSGETGFLFSQFILKEIL